MNTVKYIVVHCSDTPNDRAVTAEEIHSWHKARGWAGIGYHYVIRRNGELERGRPEFWNGAHVRSHNKESIGVCLIGRDFYSKHQGDTLRRLLVLLRTKHQGAEVLGHCDLDANKTCPNFNVRAWLGGTLGAPPFGP